MKNNILMYMNNYLFFEIIKNLFYINKSPIPTNNIIQFEIEL